MVACYDNSNKPPSRHCGQNSNHRIQILLEHPQSQLYDQTYQSRFQEPSMQLAQSAWLNGWADLKIAWKQLLTQLTEQAGLPSPKQIDILIEQLDQQRRRIRHLEKRLSALEAGGDHNG